MELDSLEMTKSSVWPALWVAPLICLVNPCESNILENERSTSDLLSKWKFKSPVIMTSYEIIAIVI